MRNYASQKANSSDFLKFKMGHKQWRQLATSTTHLALEILTKTYTVVVVQEVLQRRREPSRRGAQWPAIKS